MNALKQIIESLRFAWKSLSADILRTLLSLLGVTIGIFSITAVLTLVDSLKNNVHSSLDFLGSDVIYVGKWPFTGGNSRDWWKDYLRRPNPSYAEYRSLRGNSQHASIVCIYASASNVTLKSPQNSLSGIRVEGASADFEKLFEKINVEQGRYLSPQEVEGGRAKVVLGYEVAQALFPQKSTIGQEIKIKNIKYRIVGVMKREGESFIGNTSNDYACIIPYNAFRKMYRTGTGQPHEIGSEIGVKGYQEDVGLTMLEGELRGKMRTLRGLHPGEKDDFELKRPEAIMNVLQSVFGVLTLAGWVIGGFSILVGGFGIANIMFVSVKERTSIIGLQKSLGAKNYFILFQFLFESILLSLIGGVVGIILVLALTFLPISSLHITMNFQNILLGLTISTTIGLIAGIMPAALAARLDPVVAIRAT